MRPFMPCAIASILNFLSVPLVSGCSEEKNGNRSERRAAPTLLATTPPPAPEPPKGGGKLLWPEKIDTEVTADRRAKIEAAMPEAKGFLVATAIEEKLKANKTLKDKEAAVKAFDKLALGKWILFSGPISNPVPTGFELGVTYTPQIKENVMGMSRQWFPVGFSDVKGLTALAFKPGQMVVVLAKYTGKQKASSGEEVVAMNQW